MKKLIVILVIILILLSACSSGKETDDSRIDSYRFETLETGNFLNAKGINHSTYWILRDKKTSVEYLYTFEKHAYAGGSTIIELNK